MTANPQENVPQNAAVAEASKPNDKEYNFAQIRKQLEQERLARQQAEERAASLEKQRKEEIRAREPIEEDDDGEPYVDHKKLDKKLSKFEKQLDEKIERKAEEKAQGLIAQERKNSFLRENPDFNEIMSPEVLEKFAQKHPDVAEGILAMPDSFERQKLVYRNIKALGVHKKDEPKASIQEKIDANRRSPYYQPSGVGNAPYQSAGDFSPAGQKNSYQKMQELKNKLRLG